MPYTVEDAIQDCVAKSDTPSEVMQRTFPEVWDLFTKFLAQTLKSGKKVGKEVLRLCPTSVDTGVVLQGVNIPSFGKFTRINAPGTSGSKPIFVVSDHYLRAYGINESVKHPPNNQVWQATH